VAVKVQWTFEMMWQGDDRQIRMASSSGQEEQAAAESW
jgi:hypothetical protein